MKQKQNVYIGIIIVLLFSVGIVQYFILNSSKNDKNGVVKSAIDDKENINLPDINSQQLTYAPQRKENYSEPLINARQYLLIDADSQYTLLEKDANAQVPIASTTKVMTATIVLENYELNDTVTISQHAASQIGSDIYLRTNETITVENLLYALLVQSGNDAAMALAEKIGVDNFVNKMNEKAKYLGMDNTIYKDPAGLDDSAHSTAKDLAIITAYALKKPEFRKIVATQETTITSSDNKFSHVLKNSNRLIKTDEPLFYTNAIGIKTGFTPDAGHCLVAAAEQDGHTLISVILNTYSQATDASARESKKILEWGFANYSWK